MLRNLNRAAALQAIVRKRFQTQKPVQYTPNSLSIRQLPLYDLRALQHAATARHRTPDSPGCYVDAEVEDDNTLAHEPEKPNRH